MVIVSVLLAVSLVYGVGSLWFVWWDGGILRRTLMILCGVAIALAGLYGLESHMIPHPHSSVTHKMTF